MACCVEVEHGEVDEWPSSSGEKQPQDILWEKNCQTNLDHASRHRREQIAPEKCTNDALRLSTKRRRNKAPPAINLFDTLKIHATICLCAYDPLHGYPDTVKRGNHIKRDRDAKLPHDHLRPHPPRPQAPTPVKLEIKAAIRDQVPLISFGQ